MERAQAEVLRYGGNPPGMVGDGDPLPPLQPRINTRVRVAAERCVEDAVVIQMVATEQERQLVLETGRAGPGDSDLQQLLPASRAGQLRYQRQLSGACAEGRLGKSEAAGIGFFRSGTFWVVIVSELEQAAAASMAVHRSDAANAAKT